MGELRVFIPDQLLDLMKRRTANTLLESTLRKTLEKMKKARLQSWKRKIDSTEGLK